MLDERILRKALRIQSLPTLPAVMNRILAVIENERSTARDLTTILESDQAISARVLKLANSAFFGASQEVDSIRRAVTAIGFESVRVLALATSVFDAFGRLSPHGLDTDDFWFHALGAARAARELAAGPARLDAADALFTAGLLHDIGKFILAIALEGEYAEICRLARERRRLLRDVERERLGADHAEVGAWIGAKWRFPAQIVEPIRHFQDDDFAGDDARPAAVVALADRLSRAAGYGLAGDPPVDPGEVAVPAGLEIDTGALAELLQRLRADLEETRRVMEIVGGE